MSRLTVLDVATATGLSPHTIRSYRERGLLVSTPDDAREDYGPADLERIKLILQLQAEGLGLGFIERLVNDSEHASEHLLDLRRRVLDGFAGSGYVTTAEALIERFGNFGGQVIQRAVEMHLIEPNPDGTIRVPSPALLDAAERAVAAGISLPTAVEIAGAVRAACVTASGAMLRGILDEIWVPFEQAERPQAQVLDVARRMIQLRTLAQSVFEATLPGVLVEVFDRPFDEDLEMIRAIGETVDQPTPPVNA